MRHTSVEFHYHSGTRLRVHGDRADGRPQPELAAVLFVGGPGRKLRTVARDPRVEGVDVVSRVTADLLGGVLEKLVDKGLIQADASTGLALIQPGGSGT